MTVPPATQLPKTPVRIYLAPTDIVLLDRQAQRMGITRSELIRKRALAGTPTLHGMTPSDLNRLVADATRFTHGSISRNQVETLVSYAFNWLAERGATPDAPSPSGSPAAPGTAAAA